MTTWGEENVKHKLAKRSPAPDKNPPNKLKKSPKKDWKVEMRYPRWWRKSLSSENEKWVVFHRSVSRELCEAWCEKYARSYYISRQDQSERAHKSAAEQQRGRLKNMRIVGPDGTIYKASRDADD